MLLIILTALVVLVAWLVTQTRCVRYMCELWARIQFSRRLPGPNFFSVLFNASEDSAIQWLCDLTRTYGPIFGVWFAEDLTVFVSAPEHIRAVLTSPVHIDKAVDYEITEPWLGKGLLTNNGAAWHRQRKLLTPAFHFRILSSFREPMAECCRTLVRKLRPMANGSDVVDVYPLVSLMTLDIISETAMGIKIDAQSQSESEFVKATRTICRIVNEQLFSSWKRFDILFNRTADGRRRNAALKVLHDMTRTVIARRRIELETTEAADEASAKPSNGDTDAAAAAAADDDASTDDGVYGSKKRLAFLDSLLLAQRQGVALTDQNIHDEVNTFMFEGHDTTASAIAFALYALSRHPEAQQRAYEEISSQPDGGEGEQQAAGDRSLPYVEAVIKETLRLYPSVPFYSRNCSEPLRLGEHTLPVGTIVAVLAYVAHRNAADWPQPDAFRPERHLEAGGGAAGEHNNPFAHVAFSAGPRNCIGQRFAQLELKCALVHVLRAFELLPAPAGMEPRLVARLVLNSSNGVHVRLRPRRA